MSSGRGPHWEREELILALDLYFQFSPKLPPHHHEKVIELSRFLNEIDLHPRSKRTESFRNLHSVVAKLSNFRNLDPTTDLIGFSRGSKKGKEVWQEFANDRAKLRREAKIIRSALLELRRAEYQPPDSDESGSEEGQVFIRAHKVRERNPSLVRKKKESTLRKDGYLRCEVCGFDFADCYGDIGKGFIECHHIVPLAKIKPGHRTRLKDLALVCANCHRMLHKKSKTLSISKLKKMLERHPTK